MKTNAINSATKLLLILFISTTTGMLGARYGGEAAYQWPGGMMAGVPVAPIASGTSGLSAINTDQVVCLALVGSIPNAALVGNITVQLYNDSKLVDSVKLQHSKDFYFNLKRNKCYSLLIIAPGYYSRLLIVNTGLSDKITFSPQSTLEFEIMLIKEKKGVDDFYLDFPIASISYHTQIKKFAFNRKYTKFINKKVQKSESECVLIRKLLF